MRKGQYREPGILVYGGELDSYPDHGGLHPLQILLSSRNPGKRYGSLIVLLITRHKTRDRTAVTLAPHKENALVLIFLNLKAPVLLMYHIANSILPS